LLPAALASSRTLPAAQQYASATAAAAQQSPGSLLFGRPPPGAVIAGDADNYEMSDREGSTDEEEDEEEGGGGDGRPRKAIPDWARGPLLEAAIHAQFDDAAAHDPDRLFPEVSTCNLEEIFRARRKRYNNRTSSGNWLPDRLTAGERARYRADMGFDGQASASSSSSSSSAALGSGAGGGSSSSS
jgi:hypothetical protein